MLNLSYVLYSVAYFTKTSNSYYKYKILQWWL